jgi:hypothetical protein
VADSFNDHFHDRLKMLLLSNRQSDIFEALDIHIALARGFVNLHEFSQLHAKICSSRRLNLRMTQTTLCPKEGWNVLHLFYQIDYAAWRLVSDNDQLNAKTALSSLVQEVRAATNTQLLAFSVVSPKADLGFMLLTPDLHFANAVEKKLSVSLGNDVLTPVFSFYSLTERSEYRMSEDQYQSLLVQEKQLKPGSPDFEQLMGEFKARLQKYLQDRLYPNLPDWPVTGRKIGTKRLIQRGLRSQSPRDRSPC